ncbi:MAG: aminotransferase class V-fold PLP-dependent enzyme [Silicimonas sp.]|nr:aminotransferase class V-fold PLP-dependent enzyme [Silicimonas sp.]
MRFASDNSGPVHPRVMEALVAANEGWALPYGNDDWTRNAADKVREVFEAPDAAVYFTATGTSANVILLSTLTQGTQTIFCTPEAHIHVDECNAPEFYTGGAKLTLVEAEHGRMLPKALRAEIQTLREGGVHSPQPATLSLTQVTESGTVYTLSALKSLVDVAKDAGLSVHLDGARFSNALVALGVTAAEMSWKLGIDAVSFGGTKNGLMGVEAAVIFDPEKAWEFELRRKRGGHLFSKNRYLGAQFGAYLTDDLWLEMARTANRSAARLEQGLAGVAKVTHPRDANMIFAELSRDRHQRLNAAGAQYQVFGSLDGVADEPLPCRLVCDWSITEAQIDRFVEIAQG